MKLEIQENKIIKDGIIYVPEKVEVKNENITESKDFKFSQRSLTNLQNVHENMKKIAYKVLSYNIIDYVVICGYRGEKEQNEAYRTGMSGLKFPNSKHNKKPCLAIDVMPYPIPKNEKEWDKEPYKSKVKQLADLFTKASKELEIPIRRGIDWKIPYDPPHIELV